MRTNPICKFCLSFAIRYCQHCHAYLCAEHGNSHEHPNNHRLPEKPPSPSCPPPQALPANGHAHNCLCTVCSPTPQKEAKKTVYCVTIIKPTLESTPFSVGIPAHSETQARHIAVSIYGPGITILSVKDRGYSEDEEGEARRLIANGWLSTSNKFLTISKFEWPKIDDILQPKWKGTHIEEELDLFLRGQRRFWARTRGETRTLSASLFRAFKKLGGESA